MQAFRIMVAVVCIGLAGCGTTTKDLALQMDPSIPKYHAPECEAARQKAMKYGGMTTGDVAASVLAAPLVGTMALAALHHKAHEGEDEAFQTLEAACGHEAVLSVMQQQADDGDPRSQTWMGQAYAHGFGVKKDMALAIHWYSLAAQNGDADAETNLGTYYAEGDGVPRDTVRAAGLWAAAADRGVPQAKEDLGGAYAAGAGVKQDLGEARELFYEAALDGLGHAQFALAAMCEHGLGGEQSDVLAYEWYDVAARNSIPGASEKRAALVQKLPAGQVQKADEQIAACLSGRSSQCPGSGLEPKTALPEQAHQAIATTNPASE